MVSTRERGWTVTSTLAMPVLIAGGGPTGLTLASLLARDGVNCILAERNPCTTQFPKMDITNGTSMELLRRLVSDGSSAADAAMSRTTVHRRMRRSTEPSTVTV